MVNKVAPGQGFVVNKVAPGQGFVVNKVAPGQGFVVNKVAPGQGFLRNRFLFLSVKLNPFFVPIYLPVTDTVFIILKRQHFQVTRY